jgi:hypothetical protein
MDKSQQRVLEASEPCTGVVIPAKRRQFQHVYAHHVADLIERYNMGTPMNISDNVFDSVLYVRRLNGSILAIRIEEIVSGR